MRSGVLPVPLVDLVMATPDRVVTAIRVREGGGDRTGPTPLTEPFVIVAGAPHVGKSSLVNALIEVPGCAPVDAPATTAAWLVFRHGERAVARAFVPGHRDARPLGLDGLRVGEMAAAGRSGKSRPPRRIEVTHPGDLLAKVAIVDTPGIGDRDAAVAEVVLDAAERAAGMVVVTDATAPLSRADLDLLTASAGCVRRVAFVLTKIDRYGDWPAVLAANRALLAECDPAYAQAPWFTVAVRAGGGAYGLSGLRELLTTWADAERSTATATAARTGAGPAVQVSATDDGWRAELDREIRTRRVAAGQRVSIDLATSHVRCVQELGSGQGCPELPYVLDRELHALSVRASRQLAVDASEVITHLFQALLDTPSTDTPVPEAGSAPPKAESTPPEAESAPPEAGSALPGADTPLPEAIRARITAAARRTIDTLATDDRELDRALLLTTTAGVAAASGTAALDSLAAVSLPEPPDRVLTPIGVGLTAGCYQLWLPKAVAGGAPKDAEKQDCRRWLQRALRVVEVAVGVELARRYDDLHQALSIIAADAVDHGVLLA